MTNLLRYLLPAGHITFQADAGNTLISFDRLDLHSINSEGDFLLKIPVSFHL